MRRGVCWCCGEKGGGGGGGALLGNSNPIVEQKPGLDPHVTLYPLPRCHLIGRKWTGSLPMACEWSEIGSVKPVTEGNKPSLSHLIGKERAGSSVSSLLSSSLPPLLPSSPRRSVWFSSSMQKLLARAVLTLLYSFAPLSPSLG